MSDSMTTVELGPLARHKIDDATGQQWVTTLHPYDLAEYHWAFSINGRQWLVCLDMGYGRKPKIVATVEGTPESVLVSMREYDKSIKSCIDHS